MLEMRPVIPEEFESWLRAESRAHSNRLAHDPEALRPYFDLDRSIAVFDGSNIVGGAHSHLVDMTIPGGSTMIAGVSNIAVQPTHRRQGIMTRMMIHQIKDIHHRGQPLAALFASESVIYGRFGYGVGSFYERWTIERQYTGYARPFECPGRIAFVEPADIADRLPEVFRRSSRHRPGVFQRAPHQWRWDSQSPEHRQGGPGGLFYAAYEEDGQIDGYVTYRASRPALTVNELMAATPNAAAALWRFCFDMDLMTSTEALKRPVDDPLFWMLADPRRLLRFPRDGMWLRIIDVAKALELRTYPQSGQLVLEVLDELGTWNQGRFLLEVSPEEVECTTTNASPDLVLPVSALASVYLGAVNFSALSRAGLVEECTPGALITADAMFAVPLQPWSPVNF